MPALERYMGGGSSPRISPRRLSQRGWVFLLVALAVSSATCKSHVPARRPNVILISIDTLRSDRLGAYGYGRPTSPSIDRFAERGVRFARAISESSWTLPSHMTLMTGLYPTAHAVTTRDKALSWEIPLLAEVLRESGYHTYGFTAGGLVGNAWGFARGFEMYGDRGRPKFREVLRKARETIEHADPKAPYFLFIHTYDVHCPYDPPARYQRMFQTMPTDDWLQRSCQEDFNKVKLTSGQFRSVSDLYDAGIRAADDLLGEFVSWLDARNELDNTIMIVTSDHGEELGERGNIGHGFQLHIQTLRVPLIIAAPGISPRVVQRRVGLVDVMPTILDLTGLHGPFTQGETLVPWMRGTATPEQERPVFSELDRKVNLRSIVYGNHQLVAEAAGRLPPRLFDLGLDPEGLQPIAPSDDTMLSALLAKHYARFSNTVSTPHKSAIDAATAERLRELGYEWPEVSRTPGGTAFPGDGASLSQHLPPGTDIDERDVVGDTPLIAAATRGERETVKRLLSDGADVNASGRDGSALTRAAEGGHLDVVEELLKHGAVLNTGGRTPLMAAASRGSVAAIAILIEHGAEVNARDWSERSALHRAAEGSSVEAVQLLLQRGGEPDARGADGKTPLVLAAEKGSPRIVSALIRGGADPNKRDGDGRSPLLAAAEGDSKESIETIAALIEGGADVNARGSDGYAALHLATSDEDIEIVEALLKAGADVNATTDEQVTPLHMAVDNQNEALVEMLLANGANPKARDEEGDTPLDLADETVPEIRSKLERFSKNLVVPQTQRTFSASAPLR